MNFLSLKHKIKLFTIDYSNNHLLFLYFLPHNLTFSQKMLHLQFYLYSEDIIISKNENKQNKALANDYRLYRVFQHGFLMKYNINIKLHTYK